jgi:hypothetical protein
MVNPGKNKDKIPAAATKPTAKSNTGYFWSFQLKNQPDENIEGKKKAEQFQEEYGPMITKVSPFTDRELWTDHISQRTAFFAANPITPESKGMTTPSGKNESNSTNLNLMISRMSNSVENQQTFQGYFKTTSNSSKFVLFFRLNGTKRDDVWCYKHQLMTPSIKTFQSVQSTTTDETLKEGFNNLLYAERPASGDFADKTVGMTIQYTPPRSDRIIDLHIYTSYTYFTIPSDKFTTKEEETKWINETCVAFFEEMRKTFQDGTFQALLKSLDESFYKKIFAIGKNGISQFARDAVVRVDPVVHYTDHVTTGTANDITTYLYETRHKQTKYRIEEENEPEE